MSGIPLPQNAAASSPVVDPQALDPALRRRVLTTISCRDSDPLPKVANAGAVEERDGRLVQVMHNGLVIELGCYFGPWMDVIIQSLRGHHEPQEEVVFHAALERLTATGDNGAMIELGSWWAYYSMWFAKARPGARVVAMEPDAANLEVGRRNAALNGLESQIDFLPGGIGPNPGVELEFRGEVSGELFRVPQHDLWSLMDSADLPRAALVLSDIQGAEMVLLERAREDLARRVRFMLVSTHHHFISGCATTHQQALELLRNAGAHVIAEHTVSESYSGDGLIAVSFDPRDRDFVVPLSRARAQESLFGGLETELEAARVASAAAEVKIARLTRRLERANASAHRAQAELAAIKGSRLWQYSRPPRAAYEQLRARLPGRRSIG